LPGEERRNIGVESATIEQSHVLENLIQLYVYDFTEYVPMTLGPDGRYENSRLRFIGPTQSDIRSSSGLTWLAGFALVKKGSDFSGDESVWDMAEFWVDEGTDVSNTCSIIFQTSGCGGRDFLSEKAEVRHVHLWGTVDTPFPRPIRHALLEELLAEGHRWVLEFGIDNISNAQ
jgi:hypothetical protein